MAKPTVKAKVIWLIEKYPELRDNKRATVVAVWERELVRLRLMTQTEALGAIVDKKLSSPETILRWWRKAQQEIPDLRGKEYNLRHNIQEPEMREKMKPI